MRHKEAREGAREACLPSIESRLRLAGFAPDGSRENQRGWLAGRQDSRFTVLHLLPATRISNTPEVVPPLIFPICCCSKTKRRRTDKSREALEVHSACAWLLGYCRAWLLSWLLSLEKPRSQGQRRGLAGAYWPRARDPGAAPKPQHGLNRSCPWILPRHPTPHSNTNRHAWNKSDIRPTCVACPH